MMEIVSMSVYNDDAYVLSIMYTSWLILLYVISLAFGFCEYADPEAGLRALRLLSGYRVGDKTLLVGFTFSQ